jgi:hypothetical protein
MKYVSWRWLNHPDRESLSAGERLIYKIGIYDDGKLYNPNGYPEDVRFRISAPAHTCAV